MDERTSPLPGPGGGDGYLLLDGATGTELMAAGMPRGACTPLWCLEHPQAVIDLQRRYLEAGSRVLLAPTFGASRACLAPFGVEPGRVGEVNRRLLALTREAAAGTGALVAGDLSPLGLSLPPTGETSFEELVAQYKEQVSALSDADLFLAETCVTMAEARAAALAVRELTDKPLWVTFTCDENGRTPAGADVLAGLIVMEGMGASAFGLNCSVGPEKMVEQLGRLWEHAHVPLIAKPNAGEPGRYCTPKEFAQWGVELLKAGAWALGGCCGAGPGHIAALRDALARGPHAPRPRQEREEWAIPCAGEREARFITPEVDIGPAIDCTPELLEDILEAEGTPNGALKIAILEEDDLAIFAGTQYAIQDALCIHTDVPELLEQALRLYQGRALYDGTGDLPPEFLARMEDKYGLIVL